MTGRSTLAYIDPLSQPEQLNGAMEIIRGWHDVPPPLKGAALAIGNFDGVHRGHLAVLNAAKAAAREAGCPCGVMVFEPHPRKFFQPDKPLFLLTTLERKLELLAAAGMDIAAVLPFDAELSSLGAEDFVRKVLVGAFGIRHAVTGYDFLFGRGREGDPAKLRHFGQAYDFGVTTVEAIGDSAEIFSSTRIRELLAEGNVAAAAEMLGYWWRVTGTVESGAGRGTGLGFPTANIRLDRDQALGHGIYAVRVDMAGGSHDGAAYLGTRPTFDAGPPLLEVFLFDFVGNLYGRRIEVEFIGFVRPDAKFRSGTDLAAQMQADCAKAREILARS
jgi:riboflavin kinase/FMN adenylyltransferase